MRMINVDYCTMGLGQPHKSAHLHITWMLGSYGLWPTHFLSRPVGRQNNFMFVVAIVIQTKANQRIYVLERRCLFSLSLSLCMWVCAIVF